MSAGSLNRVEIDLAALRHNHQLIRARLAPGVAVMAMVKAEAYGHGLERTALTLAGCGVGAFGVAEVEEGVRLRQAGVAGEIVILLGVRPDSFAEVVAHRLTPVVFDLTAIEQLSALAVASAIRLDVHLKVDTGMGRFGIMPDEVERFVTVLASLPGLRLAGLLSHLPMADNDGHVTDEQCQRFQALLGRLGVSPGSGRLRHIANSAALFRGSATHLDMVRPGITLYGCSPVSGDDSLPLRPVMRFLTGVVQVKEVPAGYGVSYGHTFVTDRPSRLAILPVGYDDGYLRRLSNRASVLIRGQRVPLRGNVCMNACVADVTDLPEVAVGDEVVLMGSQGDEVITADQVARWLETINYEVLCLFGNRNRRVYVDEF
ncbi:MAG: alanine racemase [Desulfobulbaceae bacterium]|nr:alanine racemase [Desulfobulbaceae bacterium]